MCKVWRSDGVQFVSGPAGFEGCLFADVQTARGQGGDFHGLAQRATSAVYSLRRGDRAARLAGEGRCDQYSACRAILGGTTTKTRRRETRDNRFPLGEEVSREDVILVGA